MQLSKSAQSYGVVSKPKKFGDACTKSRTGQCNCNVPAGERMANSRSAQSSGRIVGLATKGI